MAYFGNGLKIWEIIVICTSDRPEEACPSDSHDAKIHWGKPKISWSQLPNRSQARRHKPYTNPL